MKFASNLENYCFPKVQHPRGRSNKIIFVRPAILPFFRSPGLDAVVRVSHVVAHDNIRKLYSNGPGMVKQMHRKKMAITKINGHSV